jgi:predicted ATPase/DNA-binding winged helix-turn-helix (wHTH) protein
MIGELKSEERLSDSLSFGPFRLIKSQRLLLRDEIPVSIGSRALDLLIALTDQAGETVSNRVLLEQVWQGRTVEKGSLRVCVAALRRALGNENDAHYVANVTGRGYAFVAPIRREAIEAATATTSAGPIPRLNLPPGPKLLIGRGDAVQSLSDLLLSRRFLNVVGPGGIGKTSVAVAIANALRHRFGDDGVCFVDLGSITECEQVLGTLTAALGCSAQGLDPEAFVCGFLADKKRLILLDGCEHVIETVAAISARIFREAPAVYLLATSREVMRAEGETVYRLRPLDMPREQIPTSEQALTSSAIQLFMEDAKSSGYDVPLSDADAAIVSQICHRLDGIPLAIKLVASRVGGFGINGTARLLDVGAELFLPGKCGESPRHQTLYSTLDWSFKLLSADEQVILSRLSVFAGEFSMEAARAIGNDSNFDEYVIETAIAGLIDKSLVSVSSTEPVFLYRLLDTTRVYAQTLLAERGDSGLIARRHALYLSDLLKVLLDEGPVLSRETIAAYASHIGNIRKALSWCFSTGGDASIACELAARAAPLFLGLSQLEECRDWSRKALNALNSAGGQTRLELRLLEAWAISSTFTRSDSKEVALAIERAIGLSEPLNEHRLQLYLLAGLKDLLVRRGDITGALNTAKRAVAVAENLTGTAEAVLKEWMLGNAYFFAGEQYAGLHHTRRGFRLAEEVAAERLNSFGYDHQVRAQVTLCMSLWLCGFKDQAYQIARRTIDNAAAYDHPVSYCIALVYSILILLRSDSLEGVETAINLVTQQAAKYSLPAYQAVALALKGELELARDDPRSGIALLTRALGAMDAEQYLCAKTPAVCSLAEALCKVGSTQEARSLVERTLERTEHCGENWWKPELLRARGEILLSGPGSEHSLAEASLLLAIETSRKQSALTWELKAALSLGRVWIDQGKADVAREVLEAAYSRFTEGFETSDLVAARKILRNVS